MMNFTSESGVTLHVNGHAGSLTKDPSLVRAWSVDLKSVQLPLKFSQQSIVFFGSLRRNGDMDFGHGCWGDKP